MIGNEIERDPEELAKATTKPRKLKWMKVNAVALVDHPANRRKFLLCKRNQENAAMTTVIEKRGLGEVVGDIESAVEELRASLEQVAGPKNAALTKEEFARFAAIIVKMQDVSKCIAEAEQPEKPKEDEGAETKKLAAEAEVKKQEELKKAEAEAEAQAKAKAEADAKAKADAEAALKKQTDEAEAAKMTALVERIGKLESILASRPTTERVQQQIAAAFGR